MLGILWLTVWATVGEAFYDDDYWNTRDYGTDNLAFEWQRRVHENFSDSLRTFAEAYGRAGEDEMTLLKSKLKLRTLKVFSYTGSSTDFEPSNGQMLPLTEGAKYCTMGRHTKVDCNHCTCVGGQLYMCTGLICLETGARPQFLSTCREGKKRKIDTCNYCYCKNGHEFCSTKDCRHNHNQYLRGKYCPNGKQRYVECNRCICQDGEEYCTRKKCKNKKKPTAIDKNNKKEEKKNPSKSGKCSSYQTYTKRCEFCSCLSGHWKCREFCIIENGRARLLWHRCKDGEKRKIDECNYCHCREGVEYCGRKTCHQLKKPAKSGKCSTDQNYKRNCEYCACLSGNWKCREFCIIENGRYKSISTRRSAGRCAEGSRYKTDSCNFCFCHKGQEYCTYKQCSDMEVEQNPVTSCEEGVKREIDACNYCTCVNGENICTQYSCDEHNDGDLTYLRNGKECDQHDVKFVECNRCDCLGHRWLCTKKICDDNGLIKDKKPNTQNEIDYLYLESCRKGDKREIDACNKCYCRYGKWFCQENCNTDHIKNTQASGNHNAETKKAKYPKFTDHEDIFGSIENIEDIVESNRYSRSNGNVKAIPLHNVQRMRLKNKCRIGKIKKKGCRVCTCNVYGWTCRSLNPCPVSKNVRSGVRMEPECQPEDIYKLSACKYCFCDYNQKLVCFNDKHCPYENMPLYEPKGVYSRPICSPGRTQETNCYVCECKAYGWHCTKKMKCRYELENDPLVPLKSIQRMRLKNGCRIGKKKRRGCQECKCLTYGWTCRYLNPCPVPKNALLRESENYNPFINHEKWNGERGCVIGTRSRISACNYCWCTSNRIWKCSNHTCSAYQLRNNPLLPNESNCIDGSKRQVNACNHCICQNGTEFCTQNPCREPDPITEPFIFSDPECFSDEPLPDPDPCNQCICVNSNIMCTKLTCVQRTDPKIPACVEGHRYNMNDGCNYCICQGGQDFCTSRACLVTDKRPEKNSKCSEGEMKSAGDNCNICVCIEGKFTCTNKDCSDMERSGKSSQTRLSHLRKPSKYKSRLKKRTMLVESQHTTRRCIPGKTYALENDDPNCPNDCICDNNELLCTKRPCQQLKYTSPKLDKYRSAKNIWKQESCTENSPLPTDDPCNSCRCQNGRKVCVLVSCSENDDDLSQEFRKEFMINAKKTMGNVERKKSGTFCEPFTFYSPDNNRFCRNCFCLHNGLSLCLLNLCKYSKDIPHHSHQELSEVCTPGETGYPTKCVTCTCSSHGTWICSREELALCEERDCDEKDEFQMGFHPYCAGCKCSVKEWFCSIHSNSCNDYSNVTCPIGTFIRNPNQHCSLCLCGGDDGNNLCFTESKCVRQVISHLKD